MSKPVVAVVGRPNVGKSTFFNSVVGQRISIVQDTPGITRDRIYAEAEWNGVSFDLIDTGGIEPVSKDHILTQMREQAELAIDTADVICFMVNGREGLTATDEEIAAMLKKTGKRVLLLVNKIDDPAHPPLSFYDFYRLSLGDPLPLSSANRLNLGDVLDAIVSSFPPSASEEEERIRTAIIGKPNVGKSSLINALLREDRVIVSPQAGTTRDAVDMPFTWGGEQYTLIDTAGIRRKARVTEEVERYSVIRALAAIERSDVCVVMIDAAEGLTEQDKKIAGLAHEAGKGIVVAVNKWDLVPKETNTMRDYRDKLQAELAFMRYAPILFLSVVERRGLASLMRTVKAVSENRALRIPTGRLNSLVADAVLMKQPPADKGRRLKIYYVSQIGVKPPLFAFSINDRALMHFSYARYLENCLREAFRFEGSSVKFVFREKKGTE